MFKKIIAQKIIYFKEIASIHLTDRILNEKRILEKYSSFYFD